MSRQYSTLGLTHGKGYQSTPSSRSRTFSSQCWGMKDEKGELDTLDPSLVSSEVFMWISQHKRSITAAAAATGAAMLVLSPAVSNAVSSLGEIVGGTSAGAVTWLDSLSQTGFYQAFSLVFVSEIGDKTFFIAGLLAMKTSRLISFIGSIGALAVMTIISVLIGQIFHAVPSGLSQGLPLDDIAAVAAFAFFGIKTLKEAIEMDEEGLSAMDEEFADAEEAVEGSDSIKQITAWGKIASIFALVFAAEFGDRSFLATIALGAAQNPVSVAGGAIAAHAMATGIAVAGGAYIAKYVSEKVIGYIGGTLFLVFAFTTALGIF
eukprot:scaffold32493_cov59-Attheya_sp.AAC.8